MKRIMKPIHVSALTLICLLPVPQHAAAAEGAVDFAKDIQPIFLNRCIECHGPEKQKGKLRLDIKSEAFKEETVIVAGKPDESELYARVILPADHDDIMPAKGEPLTKAQIDLLKVWIETGAQWPDDLVIKAPEDPNAEKDPRAPIEPSAAEKAAIEQLAALGIQVRPVAMNVTWTLANFRGVDDANVSKSLNLLKDVQTLEELNLAGKDIKDEDLENISGLHNLTRLHLEKTPITDAGLVHIKGLANLQYLNLYDTKVSDGGLIFLTGLKRLKNLYLWQTGVTAAGAEQLKIALNGKTDINRGWETAAVVEPESDAEEGKADADSATEKEGDKAEAKKEEKKEEPKAEEKGDEKAKAEKKDN